MLRSVVFCVVCLVVRGLKPEACFAVRSRGFPNKNWRCRKHVSVQRGHSRGRYAVLTSHLEAVASSAAGQRDNGLKLVICDIDNQGDVHSIPRVGPSEAKEATPTEREGHLVDALMTACRAVFTGTVSILACVFLAAPVLLVAPPSARATTGVTATQQVQWFVAPRPSGRVRPPPPEIPPGRITILQWCERNVGRYLPRLEVHEATETPRKIVIDSIGGPVLTVGEMRRILRDAVKHKPSNPLTTTLATHRAGQEGSSADSYSSTAASKSSAVEETPSGSLNPVSPKSVVQEQIDAVKTELLELQKAPPQQSGVSSGAFSSRDRPSLMNRFSVNLPSLLDENTWAPTDSGRESPPAKSARKRRVSLTTEKEEKRPREASFVVDLKAELRTESERAAAASRQPKQTENVPDSPRVRLEDAELLSPTTPYSSTDGSLPTDGVPLKAFTQGDSEKVGFQSSSESSTSTARSLPQEVKGVNVKESRGTDDSREQARDSLDRLQTENELISGNIEDVAASAVGMAETIGREGEKLVLSAEGAGRALKDGILAVSKSASEGLPTVQNRISVLSSQVAETSARTTTKAPGAFFDRSGELLKRLSGVSVRWTDIYNRAESALGELSNAATRSLEVAIRGTSGDYLSGEGGGVAIYTAVGLVVVGTAGIAIGTRAEGWEKEKVGRERDAGKNESEGKALQPIGTSQEAVASNEGELFGVEAMAATGTLWDMIRESGTGAGDAVRGVSEEDLLARATLVGRKLRETADGLAILKKEVLALRRSIRESDLEGKANSFQQELASALEGSLSTE